MPSVRSRLSRDGRFGALFLALAAGVVLWFFGWTASPGHGAWRQAGRAEEYYNSEIDGFRSGHLWLSIAAPAGLQALPDPYDPARNAPYRLHDASYFRGHYYLYFGVTPALVFFWPIRALTGRYASEMQAVLFFSSLGFLTGTGLLAAVRRRYFPQAGTAALLAGVLAIGLAAMLPALLRRPSIYEVPIACGYAGCMLTLAALWRALQGTRAMGWTAAASLAFGLTVGARPTYALGAVVLLLPLWQQIREQGRGRRALALLAAAVIPAAAIAAGLMLYNFERFHRPFEFGQTYQLSGMREEGLRHFSLAYLPFNLRVYLLAPARLSAYFPYVTIIRPPPAPAGQFGIEDPFGILPNLPFAALALLAPLLAAGRPPLARWCWAAAGIALAAAGPIFLFGGACGRYLVDFLPGVVLLGAVAVLAWEGDGRGPWRWPARLAWSAALAWSAIFGILASIQHNDLLRINHPAVYAPLARIGNLPSHWLDRLRGKRYGPLELTLTFPAGRVGRLEPLLVSGAGFKTDYLYVYYPDAGHVIFGYEHTGYGGPLTEPVPLDFRREHRLRIDVGALYPPPEHPFFARWSQAEIDAHVHRLRLELDGEPLMNDPVESYDPFARSPYRGFSPEGGALGRSFTGVISGQSRVAMAPPAPFGALQLYLEFPPGPAGASDPLVTTGVAGKGDLIRVEYVDAGHVRFVHDRWGFGGSASAAVPVAYVGRHHLELSLGSLYPDGAWAAGISAGELARLRGRLRVVLDGTAVLDLDEASHPADPATVAVGANAIGASYARPRFTGRILNQRRAWHP